jgi:hypothetical protein
MSTPITTQADVVTAAMGLAKDVAEGRLAPADLELWAVTELRALFGTVVGPDDPVWSLQCDVARQAVALGALTAGELSEWAAVMRRRAGEQLSEPEPANTLPEPVSSASEVLRAESVDPEVMDVEPGEQPEPDASEQPERRPALTVVRPPSPRRAGDQGYDALRGWDAGSSRRS